MTIDRSPARRAGRANRWLLRAVPATVIGAAALLSASGVEAAQPSAGGCPSHTWALNGPAEWLAATKAGIVAEGSTFEEQRELFGFATDAEFEAWIVAGVFDDPRIDANDDDLVCRSTNTPSGYPEYYFQVHDNKYKLKS